MGFNLINVGKIDISPLIESAKRNPKTTAVIGVASAAAICSVHVYKIFKKKFEIEYKAKQEQIKQQKQEMERKETERIKHKYKIEENEQKHRQKMEILEKKQQMKEMERKAATEEEQRRKTEEEKKAQENLSETEKKKARDQEVMNKIIKELGLCVEEPPEEEPLVKGLQQTNVPHVQEYLIPKLICPGDRVVLVSPPGEGKSILAVQFGIEIAGERKCELFPRKETAKAAHRVLYYDAEMEINERVQRYGNINSPDLLSWIPTKGTSTVYYFLDYVLVQIAKYTGDITIVLDNISAIFPDLIHSDAINLFEGFKTIQRREKGKGRDITFILVTHTIKKFTGEPALSDIAGDVSISRFSKVVISLYEHPTHKDYSILSLNKNRNGKEKRPKFTLRKEEKPYLHFELVCDGIYGKDTSTVTDEKKGGITKAKKKKLTDEQIVTAKEMIKNGVSKKDVANQLKVSRPTLDDYLKISKTR